MPDYASILRRSVAALPDPTAEMREAVYQRARAALARQLTAVDPPLSTREIENQHQELEDAVVRLEAEFAPQDAPSAAPSFTEAGRKEDFLYSAPEATTTERRPPSRSPMHDFAEPPQTGGARYEEEDDDFEDEDERPSRIPILVGLLCVVLVVIGAGAYVYAERDTLFSFLADGGDEVAAEVRPVGELAAEADNAADKRPDRLTNGTETPPAVAPADEPVTGAAPVEGAGEQDLASLQSQTPGALEEPATSLVEQRAIYYFQGAEGQSGQASEGTATWAEITKDNHPAIQATIRIADRDVTVTVTIYKNYDTALPASHLVEVQFSGALSQSPILRVPALVLKQTEQARGQPLAGAAVPVTNELFWIALSNAPDEAARNVQLLGEGSWFDVPILFSDQTRALITFEKGIPGDKVFETVMASWTSS